MGEHADVPGAGVVVDASTRPGPEAGMGGSARRRDDPGGGASTRPGPEAGMGEPSQDCCDSSDLSASLRALASWDLCRATRVHPTTPSTPGRG